MSDKGGHSPGTTPPQTAKKERRKWRTLALQAIAPRLLDPEQAALYLGVSPWTIREWEASGKLRRVHVPLANGRDLRRVLFDRGDLDALVERWKGAS